MLFRLFFGVALLASVSFPTVSWRQMASVSPRAVVVEPMMLGQASPLEGIAPAFSPDGKLVCFGKRIGKDMSIFESEQKNGRWSEPRIVSFSGHYTDLEPAFDPHGRYIIFASNRPLESGGPLAEGNYDGKVRPGNGGHLWRVDRVGDHWGEPRPLPERINASNSTFSPGIEADGSLYWMRPPTPGDHFHLYRSQMTHGEYAEPERVSFSNLAAYGDFDPVVAPDGSFLIFSSPRPPSVPHRSDLFIVYRKEQGWAEPVDLAQALSPNVYGVEARLSPDRKTLYFTNGRRLSSDPSESAEHPYVQHTWQVDLSLLKLP
jgi:Tol biopolymer transport system component